MRKTFQYRIYPNKNSEVNSIRTLSTCRYLYNEKLAERKKQAELNRLKKQFGVFPWGRDQVSAMLIENRPSITVGTTGIHDRQGLSSREPMQRYAQAL